MARCRGRSSCHGSKHHTRHMLSARSATLSGSSGSTNSYGSCQGSAKSISTHVSVTTTGEHRQVSTVDVRQLLSCVRFRFRLILFFVFVSFASCSITWEHFGFALSRYLDERGRRGDPQTAAAACCSASTRSARAHTQASAHTRKHQRTHAIISAQQPAAKAADMGFTSANTWKRFRRPEVLRK